MANIINLLDHYEEDGDFSFLYISAWITRVSVLDIIERNQFPSSYTLFVPIYGHQTRLTLSEVYMMTITRILAKADERGNRIKQNVQDILDKKEAFYDIDSQLSDEQKNIFL